MRIRDLKAAGHAPSLVAAFLHFDISFTAWVILGALMPFIAADPALTGAALYVTPRPAVQRPNQVTLLIKPADSAKHEPADRVHLILKPGGPARTTRAAVQPLESYFISVADPASLDAVNTGSHWIHLTAVPGAHQNPNETVLALQPLEALLPASYQTIAIGYPASTRLALVGLPLLAAAFWRILLGILADRFGCKRVGMVSLLVTLLPLLLGWKLAASPAQLQFIGFLLGVAGASFAVALPLASRWYPPRLQGLAMGIAGAGNSGTVLATLFAPFIAQHYGWHAVFAVLAVPVSLVFVLFSLLAREPALPSMAQGPGRYWSVLREKDTWWLCLFYLVTFGGFVGMSSFFNTFFVDQFGAPKAAVGLWTAPFILIGSLLRPLGGYLSDRFGGLRLLSALYATVIVCLLGIGLSLAHFGPAAVLLLVMMGALGMGNGAVFQLVPQRFRNEIGVVTGLVGAAGGTGGYYLNFALGHLHDWSGTYASGFDAFAVLATVALVGLLSVSRRWSRTWLGQGGRSLEAVPTLVRHSLADGRD